MGFVNVIAGGPKGGAGVGSGFPVAAFAPGAGLTTTTTTGSTAGQASVSNLPGAAWSITTAGPLAINAASGALTTTGALSAGTLNATITATALVGGQTVKVTMNIALTVSTGGAGPAGSLDFGQAGNPLETVI